MQSSQVLTLSSDINLSNPIITFGIGLVIGSFIGTTGLVILGLLTTAYYYQDSIFHLEQSLRSHITSRVHACNQAKPDSSRYSFRISTVFPFMSSHDQ